MGKKITVEVISTPPHTHPHTLFFPLQVLHKVDVVETLRIEGKRGQKKRIFTVMFHFLPPELYQQDKSLQPQQILRFMEDRWGSTFRRLVSDVPPRLRRVFLLSFRVHFYTVHGSVVS